MQGLRVPYTTFQYYEYLECRILCEKSQYTISCIVSVGIKMEFVEPLKYYNPRLTV